MVNFKCLTIEYSGAAIGGARGAAAPPIFEILLIKGCKIVGFAPPISGQSMFCPLKIFTMAAPLLTNIGRRKLNNALN